MRRWSACPPKSQSQISRSTPPVEDTGSFQCVAQAPTVESLGFHSLSTSRMERPVLPTPVSPTRRTLALVYCTWASSSSFSEYLKSHTRITPFAAAEKTQWPSGLQAALLTLAEWPSSTRKQRPVSTSQSRTVSSSAPERARLPSGLQATLQTLS